MVRFLLILFSDPESGKRDSDPRPQPWQGCALPTELFPHYITNFPFRESLTFYSRGFIHPPPDVCEPCNLEESLSLSDCECKDMSKKLFSKTFVIFFCDFILKFSYPSFRVMPFRSIYRIDIVSCNGRQMTRRRHWQKFWRAGVVCVGKRHSAVEDIGSSESWSANGRVVRPCSWWGMTTGERGCVVFRLFRAEQWLYLYVDNGWHNMIGVSFCVLCRSRLLHYVTRRRAEVG